MAKIKKKIRIESIAKSKSKWLLFAGIILMLAIIGKQVVASIMRPAGINELTTRTTTTSLSTSIAQPPSGCYYIDVQCIAAPCNPVLVCNSPSPFRSMSPIPTTYPSPSLIPSSPIPSPVASISPSCRSKIATLRMTNRCSPTGFSQYSYQCVGGTAVTTGPSECIDAIAIHRLVSQRCGLSCNN